jgi:diguanylate cyclase (GGDEF)-like protein
LVDPNEKKTREVDLSALLPDETEGEDESEKTANIAVDVSNLIARVPAASQWTLSILNGAGVGLVQPIEGGEAVLGRADDADVVFSDDGLSRRHAVLVRRGADLFVRDLGSTNGTFVEQTRVVGEHRLSDGDTLRLAKTFVRVQLRSADEVAAMRALYESSVRDPLTKLYNRRHLNERLGAEHAYAVRHRTDLSVLLMDLDHFKRVNDTHGHQAGDAVLRAFAQLLERSARREDVVARYGGEEFIALLRGVGPYGAEIFGQRICRGTERMRIIHEGHRIEVTSSVGVATWTPAHPYSTVETLVGAADQCLYRAKQAGRNLVICDASPRSAPPMP